MINVAVSRREVLLAQLEAAEETGLCTVEVGVPELRELVELQRLFAGVPEQLVRRVAAVTVAWVGSLP